jgi:hypothetical protein
MTPSAKMASTLRLFTREGREETFSTTLVEDAYSRHLRALVADGFLSMEYTGTRRVYTLTPAGRAYLEGKRMGRKKQTAPKGPAPEAPAQPAPGHNDHAEASRQEAPARPRRPSRAAQGHNDHAEAPRRGPGRPKKPRAQPASAARVTPAAPARGGAATSPLDVIRLMREVRDYADAHEGVDGLLTTIRRVEELGLRFGGLDCVRESLEAIQEFRREK